MKAIKFDPALGSGIVVTGLTDAFGFLSFLGLATLFIQYLDLNLCFDHRARGLGSLLYQEKYSADQTVHGDNQE